MKTSRILSSSAALAFAAAGTCTHAAAPADEARLQFFATERLWNARWDHRLIDAAVTAAPTATSPTEVTVSLRQHTTTKVVPIHGVGLRYKDLVVSASGWSSTFDMSGVTASGNSKRKELDFTVGYVVYPGVTASLAYKRGEVESAATARATALMGGLIGRQKGTGLLGGISAGAPLSSNVSLYGNLAYGTGRYQVSEELPGNPKSKTRYTIGDFSLAYRFDTPGGGSVLDTITLQLGYRFQSLVFTTPRFDVPASPGVRIVGRDEGRPQVTTEGVVLSASFAF